MGQKINYGEGYELKGKVNPFLRYLAQDDPKRTVKRQGVAIRQIAYPLIRKLSGPMTGVKGVLVRKESLPPGPKIFAVTHTYSREDIAWGISLAGEQSYLITNAYQELLYTLDGWALWAAGVCPAVLQKADLAHTWFLCYTIREKSHQHQIAHALRS